MVLNLSFAIPNNNTCSSLHLLNLGSSSSSISSNSSSRTSTSRTTCNFAPALLAAAVIFKSSAIDSNETLSNIPQTLSGNDSKQARIQRPKSRKAETCMTKCVGTCIRGGGEGPLTVRGPIVVFKQGFRSRQYCLVECSDICNLIKDGEDGPGLKCKYEEFQQTFHRFQF